MDVLVSLLVLVVILGLALYLVQRLPIPEPFGVIAVCIIALIGLLYLLHLLGLAIP